VQQLVHHAADGVRELVADLGIQVGQPAGHPQQLGVDHLAALRRSA